ncbi:transcription factor IIA, alpha/beta subunit [Choanephora cucurbitarum]|nr:transcription factor IIA, alpha/beta subunit [Choanephora cucurbitarum]
MSNAIVSNVYRFVIDDVINQVRGDFEDMGIDDSILQELQRSWESKVARSRVANFGFKDNGYYEEENGANNGNETQATGPSNVPVNQSNDQPVLQYPSDYAHALNSATPSAASLANLAATATAVAQGNRNLPPQGYGLSLPPPTSTGNTNPMNRMADPNTLVNQYPMMHNNNNNNNNNTMKQQNLSDLQLPGISNNRPNLPQNDGANDDLDSLTTEQIDQRIHDMITEEEGDQFTLSFTASTSRGEPLALDTLPESVKALMREAKANSKKRRMIDQLDGEATEDQDNTQDVAQASSSTGNEDDINSDLDDSDDNDDEGEGGEEIEHIILCLYDKVTRTKNKWKCILKDGIMLVNGRDYLFHRANGDFEW